MKRHDENRASTKCTPESIADVLAALGTLMRSLHRQDLALQNAVSELAVYAPKDGAQVAHIQHIDLITQTHDDLSRFLPQLATALTETNFDEEKLAKMLRLQSLRDQLLNPNEPSKQDVSSGELSLF